jgi:ADP-ribose pyrophosphatase
MTNEYHTILENPELTPTLGDFAKGEIQILPTTSAIVPEQASTPELGVVYQDKYIRIVRDKVLFPSGERGTYIRILLSTSRVGGVCIVPTWKQSYVLIRHFRHPTRSWHLEFPRGFAELDCSLKQNASRELREEIGASAMEMEFVGEIFPDTGLIGSSIGIFRADLSEPPRAVGDTGVAELVLAGQAEVEDFIRTGVINDAISMAAFARARREFA